MAILKEILLRRSVRAYTEEKVSKEDLSEILEAGNLAPTGRNRQNLLFVGVLDEKKLERIREFLSGGKEYYGAKAIVFLFEREEDNLSLQNAGAAMENMMLEATSLGLGTCWIHCTVKNFLTPEGRKFLSDLLNVPEDAKLLETLAVGHYESLPEAKKRNAENVRLD